MPLVRRTRATLRSAEFGFFGVIVYTRVQTPRRWGAATFFLRPLPDFRPGVVTFLVGDLRPLRMSWLVVGMRRVMVAAGGGPLRPPRWRSAPPPAACRAARPPPRPARRGRCRRRGLRPARAPARRAPPRGPPGLPGRAGRAAGRSR